MLLLVGCTASTLQASERVLYSWMEQRWPWRSGTFVSVGGMKGSVIRKRQWWDRRALYGRWKRCLESGGGVGTLPPNLKFRKLLKSADSSGTCIHPALRQGTLSVNGLELKIQVGLTESHSLSSRYFHSTSAVCRTKAEVRHLPTISLYHLLSIYIT